MWSKKEWLIFLIAFIVIALFTRAGISGPNDESRLAAIQCLVENNTFAIDCSPYSRTIDKVYANGHFYSDKPAFSYLVSVPSYLMITKFGINLANSPGLSYYLITISTMGLLTSIMLVYFFRLMQLFGASPNESLIYTATLLFVTLILPYSLVINNHILGATFLLISFYLFLIMKTKKQFIIAGLMAGLTLSMDEAVGAIFLVLFIILLLKKHKFKNAKYYLISAALPVLIYLAINLSISGSIMPFHLQPKMFNYEGSAWKDGKGVAGLANPTFPAMLRYLKRISIGNKGLFTVTPLLFFSLAGLILTIKRKTKYKKEAIFVIAGTICTLLFFAAKTDQYGGCNFGFRYTVPLIPIIFAFTPFLFNKEKLPYIKALFLLILLFSILVTLTGVILGPFTCSGDTIITPTSSILVKLYHTMPFT